MRVNWTRCWTAVVMSGVMTSACGACAITPGNLPPEPDSTETVVFPTGCVKSVAMNYVMDESRAGWVDVAEYAAKVWFIKSGGCALITIEPMSQAELTVNYCRRHSIMIEDLGPEQSDGSQTLGQASRCESTEKAVIHIFERYMDADVNTRRAVMLHEMGHEMGLEHLASDGNGCLAGAPGSQCTGTKALGGCVMSPGVGRDTVWCDEDTRECERQLLCF